MEKISIKKQDVINRITKNKEDHIIEYKKAVIAYKETAKKELKSLNSRLKKGDLTLNLNLITPKLDEEHYNNLLEMFNLEVGEIVSLTKSEFEKIVLDKDPTVINRKFINMSYI